LNSKQDDYGCDDINGNDVNVASRTAGGEGEICARFVWNYDSRAGYAFSFALRQRMFFA
jgi:hypothetical protein